MNQEHCLVGSQIGEVEATIYTWKMRINITLKSNKLQPSQDKRQACKSELKQTHTRTQTHMAHTTA